MQGRRDPNSPENLKGFLENVSNQPFMNVKDSASSKFPVKLGQPDPEDRKFLLRSQLVNNQGMTDAGLAVAGDDYFRYKERQADMELLQRYEAWAIGQSKLDTPESREWWYRVAPWIRDKQMQVVEEQAALQKQMARIKILGPQTDDDLKLIFAYKAGLLNVSDKPLYQLADSTEKTGGRVAEFTAGRLNPWSKFFITEGVPDKIWRKDAVNGENANSVGVTKFSDPFGAPARRAIPGVVNFIPTTTALTKPAALPAGPAGALRQGHD